MVAIKWTPQANEDLESIARFISRDSPHYAQLFVIDALGAVERLGVFPQSGRIVYRVKPDLVEILTVHHGARLLDPDQLG